MGSLSIWHWIIVILMGVLWIVPFWKIFPRAGWPAPLSLLMVFPLLNLVLTWILAFKRWPGDQRNG
jgi:hypothetical protein